MKRINRLLYCFISLMLAPIPYALAQDPSQPANNYGLTNILDGAPPGTGTFWFQYFQYYTANRIANGEKNSVGTASINTMLYMQQLVHIDEQKLLGGNIGFTALFPLVNINAKGDIIPGEVPLSANPSIMGDITIAPNIQWFNRKLFGKSLLSRLELVLILPTGAYNEAYTINPGSNFFTFDPGYVFTYAITPRLSTSQRHHYSFNFRNPDNGYQTGQLYHTNYSLEYQVFKPFRIALHGYFLKQLTGDSYLDNKNFFWENFNISTTREQVFAIGPSINYISKRGLFFECKTAFELAAANRPEGIRTTFRLIAKLK